MTRGANAAKTQDKKACVCVLGRLKINNLKVLDFQAKLSSNGNGIDLTVPLAGEASLVL
jgi:hypothetical protein